MRAIQVTEFGGPEVLLENGSSGPAAGRRDGVARDQRGGHQLRRHAPDRELIPGGGRAADDPGRGGGRHHPDWKARRALVGGGGYAERVLVAPAFTYEVPAGVTTGRRWPIVLQARRHGTWCLGGRAHLKEGESVVVHAAAGGVGTLAIQLAKRWGAGRVIAAASSEEKAAAGAGPRRRRCDRCRRARHEGGEARAANGARSTSCWKWSAVRHLRRQPRRARPVRAAGVLRHGGP